MRQNLARAWSDTLTLVRPHRTVYGLVVTTMGALVPWLVLGTTNSPQWTVVLGGALAANVIAFGGTFLLNLVASPYRISQDKVRSLGDELGAERLFRLSAGVPAVSLAIEGMIIMEGASGAWVLTVEVLATNLGAPSPLRGWRLEVQPGAGREPVHAHLLQLRDGTVQLKDGSPYVSLTKADSLEETAGLTEIPRGGCMRGHLRFVVRGITATELKDPAATQFRLSAIDVAGNRVTTAITFGELQGFGIIPLK